MVILPIIVSNFNTVQVLFARNPTDQVLFAGSPTNQLDHESARVTQEYEGKSESEGWTGSLLLTVNSPLEFLSNTLWK